MKVKQKFWSRRRSNNRDAGDAYERFIAENYYSFDDGEWTIEFSGINNRLKDLGRDLVITNEDECIIVQCKYWSSKMTVRERHIFQLYGTSQAYKLEHPNKDVRSVFYTSTEFSEEAKLFAKLLNIEIHENVKPSIDIVKAYKHR
jgi:hypothetical protein